VLQAKYFDEIPDEKVPKDMLDLALHIVRNPLARRGSHKMSGLLIEGQQIT
jgi:hypothetical protein